jgi:hypothetical protein
LVVDRNKRPALTSPWKIGFLVSLLLVTVSIGVGYAITRNFGVAWSWISIGDGTWAFNKDAFLQEMLPLVVIVPAMSLLAYFLITGAVRKYKAYLASGQDYNRLVKSIQQIEDLEKDRLKSLGEYPELRTFLLKIKNKIAEREKKLDAKEKALEAQDGQASAVEQYKAEVGVLIGAIGRGPDGGFNEELALSLPELKQVEGAIRQHLLGAGAVSMSASDVGDQLKMIGEELTETTGALKQMMAEISTETAASQNGAREIEMYLNQLKTIAGAGAAAGPDAAATTALVDRLDQASAALTALGEETRSVAINTALQAGSGENDGTALVKLADDVRDMAARFNGIAVQYQEVGQQLRASIQSASAGGNNGQIDETIDTLSAKVTFWVERAMLLAEKLNAFERHYVESTAAFEAKLGGAPEEQYQTVDDLSIAGNGYKPPAEQPAAPDQFERTAQESPALETPEAAGPGLTGIEQDKNLFEEIGGSSEDNLFADLPSASDQEQPAEELAADIEADQAATPTGEADVPHAKAPGEESEAPTAGPSTVLFEEMGAAGASDDEQPLAPPPSQSRIEPGEIIQSRVDLSGVEVEGTSVPSVPGVDDAQPAPTPVDVGLDIESRRAETPPPQSESPQEEEKIINLYELGAVDYEPTVHQNA